MKVNENNYQIVTRVMLSVFAALILLLVISLSVSAAGRKDLSGRWHRLNTSPSAEHEVLSCRETQLWYCRYDKQPEPDLDYVHPPDETFGLFEGQETTSSWDCPDWFPRQICSKATFVVKGEMIFRTPGSDDYAVNEELIVTDSGSGQVLYVYWIDQFVCPWYRSFDAALAANPELTPDCNFAP